MIKVTFRLPQEKAFRQGILISFAVAITNYVYIVIFSMAVAYSANQTLKSPFYIFLPKTYKFGG